MSEPTGAYTVTCDAAGNSRTTYYYSTEASAKEQAAYLEAHGFGGVTLGHLAEWPKFPRKEAA